MKKMLLVLFVVLSMVVAVPAFADSSHPGWYSDDNGATAGYYGDKPGSGWVLIPSSNPVAPVGGSTVSGSQQQGLMNGNTGTILSPSATGGSVGDVSNAQKQQIENSGNSTNLIGNGIGNFSPSAKVGDVKATATGGSVINNNTANPTITNKDIGNVTIGGGFLSKTLSPEATATVNNKNTNVGIVAPEITNVNVNKPEFTNVNKIDNTDVNINKNVIEKGAVKNDNVNIQGQKQDQKQKQQQGQVQGQQQKMNNDQVIAPIQDTNILIEAPKQNLLGLPSQSVPEMNFGNGKMLDATAKLPNFAIYGIKPLKDEAIMEVISVTANIKFKNLYKKVLDDAKSICANGGNTVKLPRPAQSGINIRYQIIRAEAQKSWSTGGNLGGGGSGLAANGLGAGSGAGSLIPSWGGTKADDLFTVVFVRVII